MVANKLEWESYGVKVVPGKAWPVRHYQYDDARNFTQRNEGDATGLSRERKYLVPEFGFVTPLFKKPSQPQGRARRLYTTRPFFRGFNDQPETKTILGVRVTKAVHGVLVILCEGKNREGFYICRVCGTHTAEPKAKHQSPSSSECRGTLERFSLGHELATDVVRLQFPQLRGEWDAYSVAYAVLLGAANTLEVPDTDLNVTITGGDQPGESAVVLYDKRAWRCWAGGTAGAGRHFRRCSFVVQLSACGAIAVATRVATVASGVTAISLRTHNSTERERWRFFPYRVARTLLGTLY